MKKTTFAVLIFLILLFGVYSRPLNAQTETRKIPALRTITADLPENVWKQLSGRKQELEKELKDFQTDATVFNAKSAEDQTDAEYNALQTRRTKYIDAAEAFNRDAAKADDQLNQFQRFVNEDRQRINNQLQKLMYEADHIKVPPPSRLTYIDEGIILGLLDPDEEAQKLRENITSPFKNKRYKKDEIFATTDSGDITAEAIRGLLDNHYLGEYTLNTRFGKQLIKNLQGTHFNSLVAHSNGATIAEALIRKGIISVDELNIVGGDRSLINKFGLQELIASGKVKKVVVWVNPGDIIPMGSSCALPTPFGPTGSVPLATTSLYFARLLTGEDKSEGTKVEYRWLAGPQYKGKGQEIHLDKSFFDAHNLKTYFDNMKTYLSEKGTE